MVAYSYTINGTCTQATRVGVNGFNFRPEEKVFTLSNFGTEKTAAIKTFGLRKQL